MKQIAVTQRGSMLLESLIAILIFSMGILSIVALLGASVKDTSNAKYRTDASLLANQIIGKMWLGDRSNAALVAGYSAPAGAEYLNWKVGVVRTLPGVSAANNTLPTIAVDANNVVTVTLKWQAPGESSVRNYVAIARINS